MKPSQRRNFRHLMICSACSSSVARNFSITRFPAASALKESGIGLPRGFIRSKTPLFQRLAESAQRKLNAPVRVAAPPIITRFTRNGSARLPRLTNFF